MCPGCEKKFSLKQMFLVFSIVLMGLFIAGQYIDAQSQKGKITSNDEIIVYKNESCGCCTKWAEHMKNNGFRVVEKSVDNLEEIKNSLGVPKDKRSCHTAVMGKYVFEGHIPAQSIKKFLKKTGNLKGLIVPDMPMGSPGMDYGSHKEKFIVLSFDKKGTTSTFEEFN